MKKSVLLSAAALAVCMLGISAHAEEKTIEGEKYSRANYTPFYATASDLSGGGGIYSYYSFGVTKPEVYWEYDVEMEEPGYYGIIAVASDVGATYTSDYYVSVNDSEPTPVEDYVLIEKVRFSTWTSWMSKYNVGSYYFKKGKNKVTFHIDANDTQSSNQVVVYLDKFDIVKEPFEIKKVSSDADCNVFRPGSTVRFNVDFKDYCPVNTSFHYKVTDFWGSTIREDDFNCRENSLSHTLNIGGFDVGWYKLELTDTGGNSAYGEILFSVVPDPNKRYTGDTPFATDFASMHLVPTANNVKKLVSAVKLAGVSYIRDRFNWTALQTSADKPYNLDYMQEYLDIFHDNGIRVSDILSDIPSFRSNTDLFALYDVMKETAGRYKDEVQMWELLNEVDGNFAQWSGDVYSAMCKAMALGVEDSGSDAKKSLAGLCIYVDSSLMTDLMMKNDLMHYSDIYNLHCHVNENKDLVQDIDLQHLHDHRELKMVNDNESKPFWLTEAGIYQTMKDGTLTDWQYDKQARYLIYSTVESLAQGTARHFWFISVPYIEGKYDMGIFSKEFEPRAAYQAEAVMTYVLGKGEIKGELDYETADGYVFDTGSGDALVLWTDEPRDITLNSDNDVKLTDMMGAERIIPSVNGKITFGISHCPVYISYDGEMPLEDYYPISYKVNNDTDCEYGETDRVIIRQEFDQDQAAAKKMGYKLTPNKDEKFKTIIYNFNDKPITGKLCAEIDGYKVTFGQETVTVPAMSELSVDCVLTPLGEPEYEVKKMLKIYVELASGASTPTVSCVFIVDDRYELPTEPYEPAADAASWDVTNITAGAKAEASKKDDTVEFSLRYNGGGKWFYPFLKVDDPESLADTSGMMCWVRADEAFVSQGNFNMFAYLSDGRQYCLGVTTDIIFDSNWTKVKKHWKDFVLFSSPLGAMDVREFDPTLIENVSIGCNPYANHVVYQIKDFGWFTEEEIEEEKIEFSGIDTMQPADVEISLPNKEYTNIRLMLTDEEFTSFTAEGNKIHADLSGIKRGKYILRVIAEDAGGYKESADVQITVDR